MLNSNHCVYTLAFNILQTDRSASLLNYFCLGQHNHSWLQFLEIHDHDFCSLLELCVFSKLGLLFEERFAFLDATFVAQQFQHEYINNSFSTSISTTVSA
jgi:hypothetical protein